MNDPDKRKHIPFKRVRQSVYELKDVNHREKWETFFKKVEEKVSVDLKVNNEEIIEALSNGQINDILNRLFKEEEAKNMFNKIKLLATDDEEDFDINDNNWDMKVHPDITQRASNDNQQFYLKFLRASEKKAAVWRPAEVCTSDKINDLALSQRGDIVTNMIAKDFCDWLRNLGGLEKTDMDEEILKQLFQIGLENPAAKSIRVEMNENPAVSHHVAVSAELPTKAFHRGLHRQLLSDIRAEKGKRNHCAFGAYLPASERWQPPSNDTLTRWMNCGSVPEHLVTFSFVFQGITDLKSVKEYYSWLMSNPQFKIPDYLYNRRHSILKDENVETPSHSEISKHCRD